VVWLGWALMMSGPAGAADEATARLDVDACRRNLQLIHDGLMLYRRDTGRWPARLSDLAESTVAPGVLICPTCKRTGRFRVRDQNLINPAEIDSQTVYKWEFSPVQKAPNVEGKSGLEWKEAQCRAVGAGVVPMVRCDQHTVDGRNVYLNLTQSGTVYVSGTFWEEEVRDVLALPYLMTPRQILRDQRRMVERVPLRPAGAGTGPIDLGGVATALPGDPWQDGTSEDSLAGLLAEAGPDGLWKRGGVGFDVRALIQLDGRRLQDGEQAAGRETAFYPTEPVTIPVGRGGVTLHLLGGVVFPAAEGADVGEVVVQYAGGARQHIPWRYGVEVRDGWHDPEQGSEAVHLAWTAGGFDAEPREVPKRSGPMKVYHWSVKLDRPGVPIETLVFASSAAHPDEEKRQLSGPFLLAATLE
jgi:hypothetical protein